MGKRAPALKPAPGVGAVRPATDIRMIRECPDLKAHVGAVIFIGGCFGGMDG